QGNFSRVNRQDARPPPEGEARGPRGRRTDRGVFSIKSDDSDIATPVLDGSDQNPAARAIGTNFVPKERG
ncbi:MAG TPA: hypothetical protein VHW02_03640, partial [Rhizomicrobium sp.]|nr:hypothetical protein [Rhizomicrobium sp.]